MLRLFVGPAKDVFEPASDNAVLADPWAPAEVLGFVLAFGALTHRLDLELLRVPLPALTHLLLPLAWLGGIHETRGDSVASSMNCKA